MPCEFFFFFFFENNIVKAARLLFEIDNVEFNTVKLFLITIYILHYHEIHLWYFLFYHCFTSEILYKAFNFLLSVYWIEKLVTIFLCLPHFLLYPSQKIKIYTYIYCVYTLKYILYFEQCLIILRELYVDVLCSRWRRVYSSKTLLKCNHSFVDFVYRFCKQSVFNWNAFHFRGRVTIFRCEKASFATWHGKLRN